MHLAPQAHDAGGIARDADIHALAAEAQIAQRQRSPARRQDGRIRLHETGLADAQSAEAVDQALQISAGAREEVPDIVAGRLRAHVERRRERAAGEVGGKPGRGIGFAPNVSALRPRAR